VVEKLISLSTITIEHKVDPARNRPSDMPVIKGSFDKLNKLTGWKLEIAFDQTLKDLLDWYRNKD
jgi:GDP-4-dehydro-6-deoxy-D-mannose reductase